MCLCVCVRAYKSSTRESENGGGEQTGEVRRRKGENALLETSLCRWLFLEESKGNIAPGQWDSKCEAPKYRSTAFIYNYITKIKDMHHVYILS